MVAGVHFFATAADEIRLLDYLGESVRLFPWGPLRLSGPQFMDRASLGDEAILGVLDPALGPVELIRPGHEAFDSAKKSGWFNRINWSAFRPGRSEGIVDWNRTPALFWRRGRTTESTMTPSELGSQADSMAAISPSYQRWATRSMAWVRRNGERVWEWTDTGGISRFDVSLPYVNAVYALPGAFEFLESGGLGRVVVEPD